MSAFVSVLLAFASAISGAVGVSLVVTGVLSLVAPWSLPRKGKDDFKSILERAKMGVKPAQVGGGIAFGAWWIVLAIWVGRMVF